MLSTEKNMLCDQFDCLKSSSSLWSLVDLQFVSCVSNVARTVLVFTIQRYLKHHQAKYMADFVHIKCHSLEET